MPSPNLSSSAPSTALATATRRLLIVDNIGGTNVGGSLAKHAPDSAWKIDLLESNDAMRGPALLRRLRWRFLDRKPLRLEQFSARVVDWCREAQPAVVLSTGPAPLHAEALREIGQQGIRRVNYMTDDPWNPAH